MMLRRFVFFGSVLAMLLGFLSPLSASAQDTTLPKPAGFTANVMAPLQVTDWDTFDQELATAKAMGVNGVSVDVWWGSVEGAGEGVFDWSYYDKIFSRIKAAGLQIVPILSYHQCGGNVGDTCNIPIPSWIWNKYSGQKLNGVTLDADSLKYRSEQGNYSVEYPQVWADALVTQDYVNFAAAFSSRYGTKYARDFQEINVSLGPAGELRYPSYNSHDTNTGYPTRGALQSYSSLAVADFRNSILKKYGDLRGVNTAWGINLSDANEIRPPGDAEGFFTRGDYQKIQYGKDFVDWYNASLVNHGKTVLDSVSNAMGSALARTPIGYKVPGIHWSMTNPSYPRAAEVAAGLIQTSIDVNADATGHGYQNIIGLANNLSEKNRKVILHFTCLEMDDQNVSPQYSLAKSLVFWVAKNAAAQKVTIKGENALSGGVSGPGASRGWDNINNAFDYAPYAGLTVLRLGDVVSGEGASRYRQFIEKYRASPVPVIADAPR